MRWIANLAYLLAALVYAPVVLYEAIRRKKNRHGWGQRFGGVPWFDPQRRRIWIHAVSLGEVNATPRLVEQLRVRLPDFDIVVSTTTDTGFARAVQLYGTACVFRYPLDFSWVVHRVLNRVRPSVIVLVELEVWFNLVTMAANIPVVVVNGRMTERSLHRFLKLGRPVRTMFQRLTWVGAQDEAIAGRFRRVGVPPGRVDVTSSMKWDTAQLADEVPGDRALARAMGLDGSRRLWVCGSTGDGEERFLLEAYRQLLENYEAQPEGRGDASGRLDRPPLLCLVPRKPERFDKAAGEIERAGFACRRRSKFPDSTESVPCDDTTVLLGDTTGELRKFYALADVVFVGRSMVPLGGSDPIEAAALAKPVVVGPHMDNFAEPVRAFSAAGAIRTVSSPGELSQCILDWLLNPDLSRKLGERGRQTVLQHQGATRKTAECIATIVGKTAEIEASAERIES
jgi:3-deoxy-D-manno-octulosonic-acid transferase